MDAQRLIEALLFWKGEPLSRENIARSLTLEQSQVDEGLAGLHTSLEGRGLALMEVNDEVALVTAPQASELIERLTKEELSKDLGKAGLEALSVILYQGPIGKSDIDYIRGVNSHYILRSLMIRGLVERLPDLSDQRSYRYRATPELLAHLGVTHLDQLPEYERLRSEIDAFRAVEVKE